MSCERILHCISPSRHLEAMGPEGDDEFKVVYNNKLELTAILASTTSPMSKDGLERAARSLTVQGITFLTAQSGFGLRSWHWKKISLLNFTSVDFHRDELRALTSQLAVNPNAVVMFLGTPFVDFRFPLLIVSSVHWFSEHSSQRGCSRGR